MNQAAVQNEVALDQIARGAGKICDNGAVFAQQRIEQARLSNVRAAAERNLKPGAQKPCGFLIAGRLEALSQGDHARTQVRGRFLLADLLRIVNAGGNAGLEGVQVI